MKKPKSHAHDPSIFINRELSWLAFNERVLEEAADKTVPLLERVKFAAIAASNLDEFFMVRVAGLRRAVDDEETATDLSGLTPADQLRTVTERARGFVKSLTGLVGDTLLPALAKIGISIVRWPDLDESRRASLGMYFRNELLPVLTPLAIDRARPFPLLSSLSLNIALLLTPAPDETEPRLAVVQVPVRLPRLVSIPERQGTSFVLLEDIIQAHLPQLFPGQEIVESTVIRLARDAELELDDEGGRTHVEEVERELRRRRRSDVVRMEIDERASAGVVETLQRQLEIEPDAVYAQRGPLDLRVLMQLQDVPDLEEHREPPLQTADALGGDTRDMFSILDERDVLLFQPYDSYDPVVALLAQAAADPDVVAIKQTLYRASVGSPIVASLKQAAERNKQVTVLVEVTARFDEERNIQWARALEEAGAHVIYGVRGYKTHAKVCLIVRRSARGLRRYVHLGTGNYNERTARQYTDFALMTTKAAIAEDASAVFSALTGYSDPPRLKKLVMAPTGLRDRFIKLIERERRRAEQGQPAEIVAKMNSLIDDEVIESLLAASQAGVKILLNVRGICALRPGVKGRSDNIQVVSIIDRFLEHARAYLFQNGGDEELFVSSADWMTRNLDKRIELMFPIEEPAHKARIIGALRAMFRDNVKARWLGPDGQYKRRPRGSEPPFRVQQALQEEAQRAATIARGREGVTFVPE